MTRRRLVAVVVGLLAVGCAQRDTPEEAQRRALKVIFEKQRSASATAQTCGPRSGDNHD